MSLLADLLSKVKRPESKKEVPPHLKKIVVGYSVRRRKMARITVLSLILMAAGLIGVYLTQSFLKTEDRAQNAEQRAQSTEHRTQTQQAKPAQQTIDKQQTERQTESDVSGTKAQRHKGEEDTEKPESLQADKLTSQQANKPASQQTDKHEASGEKSVNSEKGAKSEEGVSRITSSPASLAERDAHLYRARTYELKKDYTMALSEYKKALDMDKGNFAIMNNISYILLRIGLVQESINYSEKALNIKSDNLPALINIGIAYAKTENVSMAETYLNKAMEIDPNNGFVILNLAVLYEKRGEDKKALERYMKLLKSDSIDSETKKIAEERINILSKK
ncbi:MAG: tetratricopeptide repeat protein [Nitrospirae bacterium]|nr:tetratricopeptide repeat protein [Nitrospirota bacterium]